MREKERSILVSPEAENEPMPEVKSDRFHLARLPAPLCQLFPHMRRNHRHEKYRIKSRFGAIFFLAVFAALCSCSSDTQISRLSSDERLLLGKWKCDCEIGHWVITHYTDKTFFKRAAIIYDLSKPPAQMVARGTWSVTEAKYPNYVEIYKQVSNPLLKSWIGQSSYQIIGDISHDHFEYTEEDAPIMIERKVTY